MRDFPRSRLHPENLFKSREEIKQQFVYEWGIFKIAWPWLLLGVLFQLFHNWMHNLVYYIAAEYGVYGGPSDAIFDLGFEFLPEIETNKLVFLPNNGILYTLFFMGFVFFSTPLFVRHVKYSCVQSGWRALLVLALCIALRVSSFIFTVLPSPGTHCAELPSPGEFGRFFNPPDGKGIWSRFSFDDGCSDLIFSSHMMYGLVMALAITSYTRNRWLAIGSWTLVVALGFVIVLQRSHYTVDVVVALYAVPLTWVGFRHFVPWDIAQHTAFWKDQPIVRYEAKTAATVESPQGDSL